MSKTISVHRSGPLKGSIRVPSDKSLSHRSLIFAALAKTPSTIHNPLSSEDCEATARALSQMGHQIELGESVFRVTPGTWKSPDGPLDCGNSGTTMRLLSGVIASRPEVKATLVGDASLSKRPMGRIAKPLRLMGANVEGEQAPLTITGTSLTGIEYASPVASAQIKSCILLAGLNAEGTTAVTEPAQSRNHTELMLKALGVKVEVDNLTVKVEKAEWSGFEIHVPGDISSAAFWMAAASIVPGSKVTLTGLGTNPTRSGILDVLTQTGAQFTESPENEELGEPVSTLEISHTDSLKSFTIEGCLVPRLIDEIPVLAVLATQCHGKTIIRDAAELKVKESDRIALVVDGLRKMGAHIEAREDGMEISGPTPLVGTEIHAQGDHRIAMSFAVAGLIAEGTTTIHGAESIATSYPDFEKHLHELTQN